MRIRLLNLITGIALVTGLAETAMATTLVLKPRIADGAVRAQALGDDRVSINFPEPTHIRDIAHAVSLWNGKPMLVDRTVDGKVVILAPELVSLDEANARFKVALAELGLTTSEHHGIVQIIPIRRASAEQEAQREARTPPALPDPDRLVTVEYADPVDIKDVIKDMVAWSGLRVILDRNVNGKIQIWNPRPVTRAMAYEIYLAALDQLGLASVDRGPVAQIVPQRSVPKMRELLLPAPPADAGGAATLDFPQATDIRDVLQQARGWYDRDLVLTRDVSGKVQILAPGPLTKGEAYKILVAALDELGLTTETDGDVVRVRPYDAR